MLKLDILYEDNHLLVVNKRAGSLVQGDITGDKPLVEAGKNYLKKKYNKPGAVFLGVVHRLDRPVSGVVVMARTSKALTRMNQLFQKKEVQKIYWAVVSRRPESPEGKLVHWLRKDSSRNVTKPFNKEVAESKKAELDYALKAQQKDDYLLEVKPLTGRSHQIRVQLAAMGCAIKGDLKYGYPEPNSDQNIALHARSLSFVHPVKKEKVHFDAPLPDTAYWQPFQHLV
ncbi:23S rRNA pseudouridine1911/1915/1917 synthase [Catalinimonas alkaloidigena]|uniref:RluA family pseudouridine synthase n=1 Tax=Catalinimonas alkaloidigena TaxID=1075417 RepID=UPI002405A768|nr:RluA family pseudouridine synthase [Catalinimonas alkaloidigena]MDF9800233.1 23S rRNA pseudouridine1911/1915/1917 synthase [Catalinimonas alkaloidigena]